MFICADLRDLFTHADLRKRKNGDMKNKEIKRYGDKDLTNVADAAQICLRVPIPMPNRGRRSEVPNNHESSLVLGWSPRLPPCNIGLWWAEKASRRPDLQLRRPPDNGRSG
jgi:hypothetical protein